MQHEFKSWNDFLDITSHVTSSITVEWRGKQRTEKVVFFSMFKHYNTESTLTNSTKFFSVMRLFQQLLCSQQFFLEVLKQCISLFLLQRWVSESTKIMNSKTVFLLQILMSARSLWHKLFSGIPFHRFSLVMY